MKVKFTTTNPSRWFALIVVTIGSFMAILDLTIINVAMPSITDYFKDGADRSQWILSGYALSTSIVLLCSGWFARKYGYKRIYIIGVLIFTITSFMCSIAPNVDYLIAMRLFQGVGAGIIIPLSMSIVAHDFTGKDRGLAIGILTMSIGLAVSIGPFLGGYFVDIDKWNWVFKVNIPIGIAIIVMAIFLMKNYKDNKTPKFDYIGVALLFIWTPLSLYLLSSNFDLLLFLVLIISFGLFVLRMIYARNPLIDIQIFKNRDFVLAVIVMFSLGVVLQGGSYILSEYLLYSLDYTAYAAGLVFIPVGIIQGSLSPITGSLTHKYGNRIFIIIGLFITLIYLYLSTKLALDTPHWYILLTLYLRGLGIGLSFTALTNLSLNGAKSKEINSVSGVINMVKLLAGSFSIAIVTILIVSKSNLSGVTDTKGYVLASDDSFMIMVWLVIIAIAAVLLIRDKKGAAPKQIDDKVEI